MGFLATNRSKPAMFDLPAHVMGPIAVVRQVDSQRGSHLRQIDIVCTHDFQNRRTHKLQKRDKRRHRIARQPKHSTRAKVAEKKWLTRFNRHAPDINLRSELAQCILHQVMLADRNTATDNENMTPGPAVNSFEQGVAFVATMLRGIYDRAAAL